MNEKITSIKPAHEDERGIISNIIDKEGISHIAIITSKKGSVRANHYHPKQWQYIYLISGEYESHSKNLKNKDSKTEKAVVKEGSLVTTPPMIAHAMKFTKDSVMLNITTGSRESENFEQHTLKHKLI